MDRFHPIKLFILALLLCFTTAVTAAKYKAVNEAPDEIPETAQEQEIWAIGKAHQAQVRKTSEVVNDPQLEIYLERVAARLFGPMLDQIGMEVDVLVFNDPTVNAWVYPDGTIAVQTGLLAAMENEAQLAAILGHEISHFLNRHAYIQLVSKKKQASFGKLLGTAASLALAASTGTQADLSKIGAVWTELVTSGYSRKLETKADAQGLELLVAAQYPPQEALPAFEALRIPEDDTANISKVWSSHPDIDSRLKNLKKSIKKIKSAPRTVPDSLSYFQSVASALRANVKLDMQARNYNNAERVIAKYIQAKPMDPEGHFTLGEIHRKRNPHSAFEQRTQAYQAAIQQASDFADAYKELGMAYRQQRQNEPAAAAFNQYLSLAPNAPDAGIIKGYLQSME